MVEHDLAKVGVAGSSPVFRSDCPALCGIFFSKLTSLPSTVLNYNIKTLRRLVSSRPGGGTGRHAGLKILFAAMRVRVQLPPGALSVITKVTICGLFYICKVPFTYAI